MNLSNSSHANATLLWTLGLAVHTKVILWSILLVWSLLGNILVIAVVYCNQNLRTNMNYLIVNMAVSDLLVPLIAVPKLISDELLRYLEWLVDGPLGEALCKLVPFLSNISPYVSSINLAIIAFQRFMAVVYPTRRQILTSKKGWILISFPWIVGMVLYFQAFYTWRLKKNWGYTMCSFSWSPAFEYWTAQMTFISIAVTVGFIIPFFVIIIFYTIIHYKLRKSLNNVMELIERETIRSRQRKNRRIFSMSITIILMLIMCWCPLFVAHLLWIHHPSSTLLKMRFAVLYLWFLQAAINPCIYFVFLRDFRQGLKRLCCRKTASGNEQTSTLCVCCASTVAPGGDRNQDHSRQIISTSPRTNIGIMQPQFITTSL